MASAASGGAVPLAASDMTISTTAALECVAQVSAAARMTSRTGSVLMAPSSNLRLGTSS